MSDDEPNSPHITDQEAFFDVASAKKARGTSNVHYLPSAVDWTVEPTRSNDPHPGREDQAEADDLLQCGLVAESLLAAHRLRDSIFGNFVVGFGEPAWDTLLLLIAKRAKGHFTVPIGELLTVTSAPDELARPYIAWLESHDIVTRHDDDVALTERGRRMMVRYLREERQLRAGV